jgi:hypothetical protein
MKLIRAIFLLGYFFWGGMLLYTLIEHILKNTWLDIFEIEETVAKEIEFIKLDTKSTKISYLFEYNRHLYKGSTQVGDSLINAHLPADKEDIKIHYNTRFPSVNYLGQLDMEVWRAKVEIIISVIFLSFLLFLDLFANKKYWLKIYGIKI